MLEGKLQSPAQKGTVGSNCAAGLISPPVALALDVLARIVAEVGRADDEDLEALAARPRSRASAGRDADRVPFPSSTMSSSSFIRPLPRTTT